MNKQARFERNISQLIEDSYKGFAKNKALAGALMGGGVGGALGTGDTLLKQIRGEYGDMSAGDLAKMYLKKGLTGAITGGGIGGVLGGARGKRIQQELIGARKKEVADKLKSGITSAEKLYQDMILGNEFKPVHALDYLKNSDSFLNNQSAKVLEMAGVKAPHEAQRNMDDVVKGISKYLESGGTNDAFLSGSGLTAAEVDVLKQRAKGVAGDYSRAGAAARKGFEDDVSKLISSRGGSVPAEYSSFPAEYKAPVNIKQLVQGHDDALNELHKRVAADPSNTVFRDQMKIALKQRQLVHDADMAMKRYEAEMSKANPNYDDARQYYKDFLKYMSKLQGAQ